MNQQQKNLWKKIIDLFQQRNNPYKTTVKKIIIGLGNPGKSYEQTRHNAGFLLIDVLANDCNAEPFTLNKKWNALVASAHVKNEKWLLVKPQTFMNHSGTSVQAICNYYKINPSEALIVVHDDLDLAVGTYKISKDRGAGGQNGVIDIIEKIGTKDFSRVRVGIDNRTEKMRNEISGAQYVLSKFSSQEQDALQTAFINISDDITSSKAL